LLEGPSRNRVITHEIAHGIDELAGQIDTSLLKGELQTVYHDLNNPNQSPAAKQWTPQAAGYKGSDVDREYMAEAIRAYMTDPNYMKTVAPNTAEAIRAAVNSNSRIADTLQFNSLAPFLLTAGGSALGLAAFPQADGTE
jgi:vancomycin resistance protein YoaR